MKFISAIQVAEKLQAAHEGRANHFAAQLASEPRLGELLLSLQHASLQPGGLQAFVADLVSHFPEHFQSYPMLNAGGRDQAGRYSIAQCLGIWKAEKPTDQDLWDLVGERDRRQAGQRVILSVDSARGHAALDAINLDHISFADFLEIFISDETTPDEASGGGPIARALRKGWERFNYDFLCGQCRDQSRDLVPYLERVCTDPELRLSPAACCPTLPYLLLEDMQRRANKALSKIAETEVSRTVRRELEFAISECVPVPFIGDTRFGKTWAISNWVEANPGRARIVTVPNNTNSETAFIRAHADALGISYNTSTKLHVLRDQVEFVIRNARLAIIYDEAHGLVGVGYTKATAPRRLNWVRSNVIDRGIPCAFLYTPQRKTETLEEFAKVTGYNLSQWLGRMAPPVILSDVIPLADIVAVARVHFPELTQDQLEEMADRSILSSGNLKTIELAGRRARFLARERGHAKPDAQDVLDACDHMMPAQPRVVTVATPEVPAPARQAAPVAPAMATAPRMRPHGSRPATPLQEGGTTKFPHRSTTLARPVNEPVTVG